MLISPRVRSGRRRSSPGARPAASVPAALPPAADDSLVTRLTRFLSGLGGGGGGGDAEDEGDLTERPGCTVVGFAADRLELQLRVQRTTPGGGGDACWCAARQPHDVVVGAASLWPRGAAPPPAASHAHFMATLTRVPPPGAPAPGDKTESDGAGDEQVVVRVIVVEGGACVAAAAVIDGHMTVSDSLRRRLGLDVTGRVKLTPLTTHPVRCSAISLTPLSALVGVHQTSHNSGMFGRLNNPSCKQKSQNKVCICDCFYQYKTMYNCIIMCMEHLLHGIGIHTSCTTLIRKRLNEFAYGIYNSAYIRLKYHHSYAGFYTPWLFSLAARLDHGRESQVGFRSSAGDIHH